jgi:hypothetical protein
VWELLSGADPATTRVAYETFSTSGRVDTAMLHTIELVGSIIGVCFVLGIPSYPQTPQSRRSFIEEAQKLLFRQKRPGLQHEVDALAHLLLLEYRIKKGMI